MTEPKYLYKIVASSNPPVDPLPDRLPLSDLDVASGFIHLSTASQVISTVKRFFDHESRVYLLRIRFESVKESVKWEAPTSHAQDETSEDILVFPHLYSTRLGREEVESWVELEKGTDNDWHDAFVRASSWLV
ncbi:hypothetical protein AX17_001141 [Amanita inopinata Kibby_2008]|nr:hypothetical protein AX17_001141 [Amanita inopinata Kibby_2008]